VLLQGAELLTSQLGVAADIAEEISQRLNNLPLALQMVIAYKKREMEREAEETETETDPYAFLHFKLAETERDGYNKSLYEVLDQSIQVVAQSDLGPQAVKVLNMIAFMEPSTSRLDNAVLKYMRIDGGMIAMNKIITMLQKYSLIQESGDDLVMFRLYKAILRAKCDDPDDIVKQVKQILR
jgi:CRISPR/Cas system CSM-associated protein Csm2 small subunit